jgi:hypothetical protein
MEMPLNVFFAALYKKSSSFGVNVVHSGTKQMISIEMDGDNGKFLQFYVT